MNVPFSQLGKSLDKFVEDTNRRMRLASYNTLGQLGKLSRQEIIKEFPNKFKDENGIRKNRGVPKQVVYDNKVDKSIPNNPSIHIYASDKIDFMGKQEFGGDVIGGKMGASAAVPFYDSLKKMRSGTKGMKDKYTISSVMSEAKAAIKSSAKSSLKEEKGHRSPKPFFMKTESGHTMVAIRKGRKRKPIMPLYHFDRKRQFHKRWEFFTTVEGVVVSMVDKVWGEELKKALDKK